MTPLSTVPEGRRTTHIYLKWEQQPRIRLKMLLAVWVQLCTIPENTEMIAGLRLTTKHAAYQLYSGLPLTKHAAYQLRNSNNQKFD